MSAPTTWILWPLLYNLTYYIYNSFNHVSLPQANPTAPLCTSVHAAHIARRPLSLCPELSAGLQGQPLGHPLSRLLLSPLFLFSFLSFLFLLFPHHLTSTLSPPPMSRPRRCCPPHPASPVLALLGRPRPPSL